MAPGNKPASCCLRVLIGKRKRAVSLVVHLEPPRGATQKRPMETTPHSAGTETLRTSHNDKDQAQSERMSRARNQVHALCHAHETHGRHFLRLVNSHNIVEESKKIALDSAQNTNASVQGQHTVSGDTHAFFLSTALASSVG